MIMSVLRNMLFIVILFLVCKGCRFRNEQDMVKFVFPPTIYSLNKGFPSLSSLEYIDSLKLITIIDGNCSFCYANLIKWNDYLKYNKTILENVVFVVVLRTDDTLLTNYNIENIALCLPYYIDTLNIINTSNGYAENASKTLLIGGNNEVLCEGSPIQETKYSRRILNAIKQYAKHESVF